jgi:hypothetical protein
LILFDRILHDTKGWQVVVIEAQNIKPDKQPALVQGVWPHEA